MVDKNSIFFACWKIFCEFLWSEFVSKLTSLKIYFRNTIRVSNSSDPDQAGHFVGSDLGPNFLQSHQQSSLAGKE